MKANIGISAENREAEVNLLNLLLADEFTLSTKTRNYHWNVQGMQFNDLHKFFEAQYIALNDFIDQVAERVRQLGGMSVATLAEYTKTTRLEEHPAKFPEAKQMLTNLLTDHESIIQTLRNDVDACTNKYSDAGTSDFLTGLMEEHEKMAWMLRAFLESR